MKERHLARSFNLTFRYINVVLSLNNSRDLVTISVASIPKELELKDTTDPVRSTSYLDLLFQMTNMMTFYSVLSISHWSVVTLHPLLKASPQKFNGQHTESVDTYGVSISTGAPGPCSRMDFF